MQGKALDPLSFQLLAQSPRRRNHGNCNDDNPSSFASVHPRECDSKSAARRRWLEHSRPGKVALAYAIDSRWRNRSEFVNGRNEIIAFLSRKWAKELDYRLIKELWAFTGNRIAVRFAYEWHDDSGHWYRSYGNENWEFNDDGLMAVTVCVNQRPSHFGIRSQIPLAARAPSRRPPRIELTWASSSPHTMGKIAELEDVVDAVLYLAHADQVTGEIIHVDGGAHAGCW